MTLPHDEEPLTRRELRDLERQKPRKQRNEEAKAAEVARAQRLAEPGASSTTAPDTLTSNPAQKDSSAVQGATPILSRRARRAIADHSGEQAPIVANNSPYKRSGVSDATGPIIAEIIADDEELAEIDDTPHPETVGVITIDEKPSGPILAPLFQSTDEDKTKTTGSELPVDSADGFSGSSGVGSSNSITTTSALVLPSVPNPSDMGTALDETGEVIITGSINLPVSLGSTGAAPADGLEAADLDAYLEPGENDIGSDVAPVSATRAVSTHGVSSGLVTPPKRSKANAPVVLAVTAGVLAIGVIGLLFAAFVFRIF